MKDSKTIFNSLKDKKLFSYNDLEKKFNEMQHRIGVPLLVQNRFLEYFENKMIFKQSLEYLPEINKGDKFEVENIIYTVEDIRITNVISEIDYIVGIVLVSHKDTFETIPDEIINNPKYKRILN